MDNYTRVVPRDLFNEASLLKCCGRLAILLQETSGHRAGFTEEEVERFEIGQDPSSGAISIRNLPFVVGGRRRRLERPLNSRDAWPLWLDDPADPDFEAIPVFDDTGNLSTEMLDHIRAQQMPPICTAEDVET